MYIQGVSTHPPPRTLSPADVEANLEDEGESDNEETDIGPQQPVIFGIISATSHIWPNMTGYNPNK